MKKLILSIILSGAALAASAGTNTLTFAWTPGVVIPPQTPIAGYHFYDVSGTNAVLLGTSTNTTFIVSGVDTSRLRSFAVSQVDTNGLEGSMSAPVSILAPSMPSGLRIIVIQ